MSAREVTTVDEAIAALIDLRSKVGGDAPLRLFAPYRTTLPVQIDVGHVGKADVRKIVSRGGRACVLLSN